MFSKTKIHKIYSLTIKFSIVIFAFWFIYRRIFVKDNLDELANSFSFILSHKEFWPVMTIVLLLMFCNWSIETIKWKFLVRKIDQVSFLKCLVAVFSGITVSIFTPNRIGEYAGRVFVLRSGRRWKGVFVTVLGSMTQLLVTVVMGAGCFIFYLYRFVDLSENPSYIFAGITLIVSLLVFLLLLLYFNVSLTSSLADRLPERFNKFKRICRVYTEYSFSELLVVLALSVLRYMIFITQFYLLLNLFGVDIRYPDAFILLSMVYLVMAAIPTIALTELGIRGSVSIYFVSMCCVSVGDQSIYDLGIFTASSALWLVNLAIPAIMGAIFIFRLKFFSD